MVRGVRFTDDDQEVTPSEGAGGRRSPLVPLGHAIHSLHTSTLLSHSPWICCENGYLRRPQKGHTGLRYVAEDRRLANAGLGGALCSSRASRFPPLLPRNTSPAPHSWLEGCKRRYGPRLSDGGGSRRRRCQPNDETNTVCPWDCLP